MKKINILDALAKRQEILPSFYILYISACFIALLIAVSIILIGIIFFMSQKENSLISKKKVAEKNLEDTYKEYPMLTNNQTLEASIVQMQEKLKLEKDKWQKNSQDNLLPGFSTYMKILSEEMPKDSWLTKIYFDRDNSNCTLEGYTLNNQSTASFTDKLQNQEYMNICGVLRLKIENTTIDEKKLIKFTISNQQTIENDNGV